MERTGRALFLQPPVVLGRDFIDYPYFADYGLLAATALAERAGWSVDVVDALCLPGAARHARGDGWLLGVPDDAFLAALSDRAYELVVVGIDVFQDPARSGLASVVARIRARCSEATIVLADCLVAGMHYVDYDGLCLLDRLPEADAVLKYTGERWLSNPARLTALRGSRTVVRDPLGRSRVPFPIPDSPDPEKAGAFLESCFEDGLWANPFGIDASTRPIVASLGCAYRCVFCSNCPGGRPTYRPVPLPVIEDWSRKAAAAGIRRLVFLDAVANLRRDFEALLAVLERLDLAYEFPNGLRADRLPDRAIERMHGRVNCLSISAESGSQEDLNGPIGKRLSLREVERVAATCHSRGVPLMVHFMVGLPWETMSHVRRTLDFARDLHERTGVVPSIQYAVPLPGTRLHEMCEARGLLPPGFDAHAAGLFQHRPAFAPPDVDAGAMVAAVESLRGDLGRGMPAAVSNSFVYKVGRRVDGFVLDRESCSARDLGLSELASSRVVLASIGGRFRLCSTHTTDFSDAEIRQAVHSCGQLYVQIGGGQRIDDYHSLGQLVLSAECRGCPDLDRCVAAYVPLGRSLFDEDEAFIRSRLSAVQGDVLDVGAGSAPYLDALAPAIEQGRLRYQALDPDPAALEGVGTTGLAHALHHCNIEEFHGEPGSFDHIIALRSLNHFQDAARALGVMTRLLRPGGTMLLVDSVPIPLIRAARTEGDRGSSGGFQHLRNWSSHQVLRELEGRLPLPVVLHRPVGCDTCLQWILILEKTW